MLGEIERPGGPKSALEWWAELDFYSESIGNHGRLRTEEEGELTQVLHLRMQSGKLVRLLQCPAQ